MSGAAQRQVCQGTGRRILPGLASAAVHCGVHIHRQVVFFLSGKYHTLHIGGIVPCHEYLVGIQTLAEHFRPAAGCPAACPVPELREPWMQAFTVRDEILSELARYVAAEKPFGLG